MLLLMLTVSRTGHADTCADTMSADRPGATNGHWTTDPGCALVETGFTVQRAPSDTTVGLPLLLRVGLADMLELRGSVGLVNVTVVDEGDSEVTAPPAALEVKITGRDAAGGVPGVGLIFGLASVTNSDFGAELTPGTSLLFDWELFKSFWLSVNGIASAPPAAMGERALNLAYAGVLSYGAADWLGIYANAFGGAPIRDGDFSQWAGGGLAFYPMAGLQLDVGVDVEATGDNPVLAQAGVAFTF